MNIKIKTTLGSLIFEGDFSSVADAVKAALGAGKSLSYANLSYANLRYADLRYADLRSADLSYANLRYANLRSADLYYADLYYADLYYANLRYADLRSADLSYADLSYADLSYANLRSANLSYAKNSEYAVAITRILPEGSLIGYKKTPQGVLKLRIPEEAKRSHAFGRKCRAEFVEVLEMPKGVKEAVSHYDSATKYSLGAVIKCDKWEEDFTQECAGGINFFVTRLEAENYCL